MAKIKQSTAEGLGFVVHGGEEVTQARYALEGGIA